MNCDRCNKPVDMASVNENDQMEEFPGLFSGHRLCFGITMGMWVLTQDDRESAIRVANALTRDLVIPGKE